MENSVSKGFAEASVQIGGGVVGRRPEDGPSMTSYTIRGRRGKSFDFLTCVRRRGGTCHRGDAENYGRCWSWGP